MVDLNLLSYGMKASQIAVIYRINAQSEHIENALSRAGVEYQVRGGQRYFSRPEIMSAVRMVRAEAANPTGKALYETVSAIARSLGWLNWNTHIWTHGAMKTPSDFENIKGLALCCVEL
jgi:DNA helicase-2/ATP-dependent DNA helicase PcrA